MPHSVFMERACLVWLLLLAYTCLGHECHDLWTPYNGNVCTHRVDLVLYAHPKEQVYSLSPCQIQERTPPKRTVCTATSAYLARGQNNNETRKQQSVRLAAFRVRGAYRTCSQVLTRQGSTPQVCAHQTVRIYHKIKDSQDTKTVQHHSMTI